MCCYGVPLSHLRFVVLATWIAFVSISNANFLGVSAWICGSLSFNFNGPRTSLRAVFSRKTTSLELYNEERPFFFSSNNTNVNVTSFEGLEVAKINGWTSSVSSQEEGSQRAVGTFGDIMSPTVDDADLLFRDGLVTSESYSLEQVYGISNPLDRMAVTANGNLQRLFSSYYDAPVVVEMVHCTRRRQQQTIKGDRKPAVWDRRVLLKIFGNRTFCTADSMVLVHSREVEDLVESGKVGIGQIFRRFNILPEFTLVAAGPTSKGGFWRNYTLESDLVTCFIHEKFCEGVWNLRSQ
mmetsp:Transcript_11800/g.33885  ORF Transcript_11800/g.33885 Transcript_11800/m.33885 type:complete len:295 (+) Transcript_11800:231-1115(+)